MRNYYDHLLAREKYQLEGYKELIKWTERIILAGNKKGQVFLPALSQRIESCLVIPRKIYCYRVRVCLPMSDSWLKTIP